MKSIKAFLCTILIGSCSVWAADEIETAIEEGKIAYAEGRYSEAAGQFDYVAQLIREAKGGKIGDAFPAEVEGWTVGELDMETMGSGFARGYIQASQTYTGEDGAKVTMTIATDAPQIPQLAILLNNPAMIRQSGKESVRLKDYRGMLDYSEERQSGEIMGVYNNTALITTKGNRVSKEVLTQFADRLNLKILDDL